MAAAAKWRVIDSVCQTPGAEGQKTYGVALEQDGETLWVWPDADPDRGAAEQLRQLLEQARPEPCHRQEIVEDFIESRAQSPGSFFGALPESLRKNP